MDLSVLNKALNLKTGQIEEKKEDNSSGEKVLLLEVDKIKADPNQPRKFFNAEDIQSLADDIKSHGLIQPIIVRTDGLGQYIVIAGERRLRAFQLLKEPKIRAILRNDYSSDNLGYIQIAENIKRADLKFYELAEFIISKVDAGVKQSTLADEIGLSRAEISRYMAWKEAPEYLKEAKDKFSSIRAFADLVNLAKDDGEDVENFIKNSEERITAANVADFKKSLKEPEEEINDVKNSEIGEDVEVGQDLVEENANSKEIDQIPIDQDERESLEALSEVNDNTESDVDTACESVDFENEQVNTREIDQTENIVVSNNDNNYVSDSSDDNLNWDEEQQELKLKKPVIVGSVEGRDGYLQYKKKPSTEGFVWIKWEDGFEEEILAEEFKINRIIDE